jgi:hypothetical protein
MTDIAQAQAHIDGKEVARMIIDFHKQFRGAYPDHVFTSSLCAVGPLQSMIGLAIANGHLSSRAPSKP